jgi:hypothetical protein
VEEPVAITLGITVMVSCNLERLRRVGEPMDFIENHPPSAVLAQEVFRVIEQPSGAWKLAVEIIRVGE